MTTTPGAWEEGTGGGGGGEYDYTDEGYGSFEETVANPGNEVMTQSFAKETFQ